jgi:hypothetical protein
MIRDVPAHAKTCDPVRLREMEQLGWTPDKIQEYLLKAWKARYDAAGYGPGFSHPTHFTTVAAAHGQYDDARRGTFASHSALCLLTRATQGRSWTRSSRRSTRASLARRTARQLPARRPSSIALSLSALNLAICCMPAIPSAH